MDRRILIGLSGQARVGKDTAGNIIKDKLVTLGYKPRIVSYADPLKEDLMEKFDLSYDQVYGDLKEVKDKRYLKNGNDYWTPREMMQEYGQFMRKLDPDYWVKKLFNFVPDNTNLIIPDLRQPNELIAVKDRGGHHLRISRDDKPKITRENHETEVGLSDESLYKPDYKIYNDDTIKVLENNVESILHKIIKRRN